MAGLSTTCSCCQGRFTDPRVLPCLHTFCLQCIKGLRKEDSSLTCPQCRAKHQAPPENEDLYPVNLLILSELGEANVKSGDGGESTADVMVCGFCDVGDVAVGYCGECREYLCACCRDIIHKRGKMFSSHRVISIEEAASFHQVTPDHPPPYCIHHPEYKLEVYCRTCVSVICCKCVLEISHKDHQSSLMTSCIEEVVGKMDSLLEAAKSKGSQADTCLSLLEKIENIAISQQNTVRIKINAFFDELMSLFEGIFTEDNKKLMAARNDIEMVLSWVKSSHSLSTGIRDQIDNGRYLSLVNQLFQCLVMIESNDLTSSMKDAWAISSTCSSFEAQLDVLCDLTMHKFCKEDAITQKEVPVILWNAKTQYHSLAEIVKAEAILEQPFARLPAQWSVACISSPVCNGTSYNCFPLVEVFDDHKLMIEFRPKNEGRYTFHLSPAGTSLIIKLDVKIQTEGQAHAPKATKRKNEVCISPCLSKKSRIR